MTNIIVQKLPSYFVSNDCVQVSVPFHDSLTIMDGNGVYFHMYNNQVDTCVNKYKDDDRAKWFPYNNIPLFNAKKHRLNVTYVNQLFDFNKPYILTGYGYGVATEEFAIKNGNEALIVKHFIKPRDELTLRNRDGVKKIFAKRNVDEKIFILGIDGSLFNGTFDVLVPPENELKSVSGFGNPYPINKGKPIIVVRLNDKNIKINGVMIDYIKNDCYRVNETSLPVSLYTLEVLDKLGIKINNYSYPRISLRRNPNISCDDIISITTDNANGLFDF